MPDMSIYGSLVCVILSGRTIKVKCQNIIESLKIFLILYISFGIGLKTITTVKITLGLIPTYCDWILNYDLLKLESYRSECLNLGRYVL